MCMYISYVKILPIDSLEFESRIVDVSCLSTLVDSRVSPVIGQ